MSDGRDYFHLRECGREKNKKGGRGDEKGERESVEEEGEDERRVGSQMEDDEEYKGD